MNWPEHVQEFKENYSHEDQIGEYIDSILPMYYFEIHQEFKDMSATVKANNVGMTISQLMISYIYEDYYLSFLNHWHGFDEEE